MEEELTLEEQIARRMEVRANPVEFARYVQILDYATNQIIKYELWGHLVKLMEAVYNNPLVIVIKSKQIGVSWTLALLALQWCYRGGSNVIEMSSGERTAIDLLGKSKFIDSHLPKYLQQKRVHDGSFLLGFSNHSRIHTLPSTKDAGLGETGSLVIIDENEFHDYARENYANIKPTVDRTGAHMVIVSTIDPTKTDTHFRTLVNKSIAGKSNFRLLFFGEKCL